MQLKLFARSSTHKQIGYVAMVRADGHRGVFYGNTLDNSTSGNLMSQPILFTILTYQYIASIGFALLLPQIFIKIGVLPGSFIRSFSLTRSKRNFFAGTVFSVFLASCLMLKVDAALYSRVQGLTTFAILWLPVPLALPMLVVVDGIVTFSTVVSRYKLSMRNRVTCNQNCLSVIEAVVCGAGCVVFTVFCQLLAFHIGWLFPLLIAFPTKVGTLVFLYACYLLSMILLFSGMVHFVTVNGFWAKLLSNEYYGLSCLCSSFICLASIYYLTQGSNDDGSRDGIATTMVNLFPIIVAGLLTWTINKCMMAEEGHREEYEAVKDIIHEEKKHSTEMGVYYYKKLNDLPV